MRTCGVSRRPEPAGRPVGRVARAGAPSVIGWCSLIGGILGGLDVLAPGILLPGWRTWLFGSMMALLVILGLVLLTVRRASDAVVSLLVLLSLPIYMVVSVCVADAALYAPPLMMLFGAITGAAMLTLPYFVLNCVLLVCAVVFTLVPGWPGTPLALAVQIVVQSLVLLTTSVGILIFRRRSEALVEYSWKLARRDPLTHLANRRRCAEYADDLPPGSGLALVALDLDHFKRINDAHGHAVGDRVLQAVAGAVTAETPHGLAARLGGEEFLVLQPVESEEQSIRLADRLNAAVRRCSSPVTVTCSVGVVFARVPAVGGQSRGDWLWQWVEEADLAMYAAKKAGRDRVVPGTMVPISGSGV